MLNFYSLFSGSSGNSLFIKSENTKLLVDVGVSSKKVENALLDLNIAPNEIDGILITHEHTDHIQGLGTFAKKFDIPVFANKKTFDAMPKQTDKISTENINKFKVEEHFCINDIEINPFSIPHDAANPCGFNISKGNKKMSIATDIGHITTGILKNLQESSFILLESNYEPEVLMYSHYPYILKSRIAGPTGHLSNEEAGKTISQLLNCNLKQVMLGHLSKESNFPELAYKTVVEQLIKNNYEENSLSLSIAGRDTTSKEICV